MAQLFSVSRFPMFSLSPKPGTSVFLEANREVEAFAVLDDDDAWKATSCRNLRGGFVIERFCSRAGMTWFRAP